MQRLMQVSNTCMAQGRAVWGAAPPKPMRWADSPLPDYMRLFKRCPKIAIRKVIKSQ